MSPKPKSHELTSECMSYLRQAQTWMGGMYPLPSELTRLFSMSQSLSFIKTTFSYC